MTGQKQQNFSPSQVLGFLWVPTNRFPTNREFVRFRMQSDFINSGSAQRHTLNHFFAQRLPLAGFDSRRFTSEEFQAEVYLQRMSKLVSQDSSSEQRLSERKCVPPLPR